MITATHGPDLWWQTRPLRNYCAARRMCGGLSAGLFTERSPYTVTETRYLQFDNIDMEKSDISVIPRETLTEPRKLQVCRLMEP